MAANGKYEDDSTQIRIWTMEAADSSIRKIGIKYSPNRWSWKSFRQAFAG